MDLKVTIHFGSEVISEGKKNRSKDVFKVDFRNGFDYTFQVRIMNTSFEWWRNKFVFIVYIFDIILFSCYANFVVKIFTYHLNTGSCVFIQNIYLKKKSHTLPELQDCVWMDCIIIHQY